MDYPYPDEPLRIVKLYRDSVCMGDDVCAPNSLSFRYYETDPQGFIEEVFRRLPQKENCIWVLYAADENAGKWQNIGHILCSPDGFRIVPETESIPVTLWEDTYQTVLWCEYYVQNRFHELESISGFCEGELLTRVWRYLITDSHEELMIRRYERYAEAHPDMRAFCSFEYDDGEARGEMREAFALRSFRSYPGMCLEGLFLVSILPASYALRTGSWLFLLPTAFCVISLGLWVLYNFMCGVRISNGMFPQKSSHHSVKCCVYDDFVLSIEENGKRKRCRSSRLVDIVESGKYMFLLYEKGRCIVLDRQIGRQQGKNMEMAAAFRSWRHSVFRREDGVQRAVGFGLIVVFLIVLFALLSWEYGRG